MTIKVTSVGHCCACSVTCMHIGGPWYCDSHKPHGPTMPFVPVADSAEVQRLRAELALERMERAQADAMLAKARAATEIAEHERDGVREELARMAGDLDDACSERDRLCGDKAKLAATIAAYLETDERGINHAANTAHARAERDQLRAAVARVRDEIRRQRESYSADRQDPPGWLAHVELLLVDKEDNSNA